MDDQTKAKYESQSQQLRADLKKWENDFAKTHDGKKPAREDIKKNPDIAQKYKQYNKVRDILAGKIPPSSDDATEKQQRKRKQSTAALAPAQTPVKRSRTNQTPLKTPVHPEEQDVYDNQLGSAVRKLFSSPQLPTSIGPTPQRDGRVLGLFDLLAGTPSRSNIVTTAVRPVDATPSTRRFLSSIPEGEAAGGEQQLPNEAQTPSARFSTPRAKRTNRPDRTPSSGRNRMLLDSFMGVTTTAIGAAITTPHGRKRKNSVTTPSSTKSSASKLQFATPAFLRRRQPGDAAAGANGGLQAVAEDGEPDWEALEKIEPLRLKLPRKPLGLGRGLSNIVASLRKIEEDAADEELEALREMEMEEEQARMGGAGAGAPKPPVPPASASAAAKSSLAAIPEADMGEEEELAAEVGDSQAATQPQNDTKDPEEEELQRQERPVLLGGFDDETLYDSPDDKQPQLGRDGLPLRVYKKKGQKRTTRRVNMRPTRTKRPTTTTANNEDDDGDGSGSENDDVVPETQFNGAAPAAGDKENDDPLLLSDNNDGVSDFEGGESDSEDELAGDSGKTKKTKAAKPKKPTAQSKKKGEGKDEDEGLVKKTVRKVKATAHANFKRLKLKNNGAKGGPGYNSRFRRKR